VAVSQWTLAVDRPFTAGNGEKEADFIPCVAWRQLAETCANYLRKGRLCAIEGRIQVRNYEDNEGRRVYKTEIIADNVRFLEKAPEQQNQQNQQQSSNRQSQRDPFADDGRPVDISEDDLPF
jgi:single-strand DNA-binding protein